LVAPGKYTVELYVMSNGKLEPQGAKQEFNVKPVFPSSDNYSEIVAFKKKTSDLSRKASSSGRQLSEAGDKLRYIKAALTKTPNASPELFVQLSELNASIFSLRTFLMGDGIRQSKNESTSPSIMERIYDVIYGHWNTTQQPTITQKRNIEIAQIEFEKYLQEASTFFNKLADFEFQLEKSGAPYTPNRKTD
jgi:hypothetical protein